MPNPIITVRLDGLVRGKGRPRFSNAGKLVRVYTDARTALFERRLAEAGRAAMGSRKPLDEALSVTVTAYVAVPASFSRLKTEQALDFTVMPQGKPDGDNYLKIALDSLNKIVWRDDSLIVWMSALKVYSRQPRLEVKVWRWDHDGYDRPNRVPRISRPL